MFRSSYQLARAKPRAPFETLDLRFGHLLSIGALPGADPLPPLFDRRGKLRDLLCDEGPNLQLDVSRCVFLCDEPNVWKALNVGLIPVDMIRVEVGVHQPLYGLVRELFDATDHGARGGGRGMGVHDPQPGRLLDDERVGEDVHGWARDHQCGPDTRGELLDLEYPFLGGDA